MSHHFAEKSRERLPSVGVKLVWPTSHPALAILMTQSDNSN